MNALLKVDVAPFLDPAMTAELTVPHGLTIGDIVRTAMPAATPEQRLAVRVWLVMPDGSMSRIEIAHWRARPKPESRIVIRVAPEGEQLRGILTLLVAVAAAWVAGPAATWLLGGITQGTLFGFVKAGLTLALTTLGGVLINTLLPPPGAPKEKPAYAISSLKNSFNPNGPLPRLHGKLRVAPVWGVRPYSEVVAGNLYIRAVGLWGHGPLAIPDAELKIGDTPISRYDEVVFETREGYPGDPPLTIVNRQVLPKAVGVDLTRPLPRNDAGDVIRGGVAEEQPEVRISASDASHFSIILSAPTGMIFIDKKGKDHSISVTIRRRQRLIGSATWLSLSDIVIRDKTKSPFFRQETWAFPTRGRWEVELTMMTPEFDADNSKETVLNRITWVEMQSWRPEYPFVFDTPQAMTALRIKATAQLQGGLEDFNGLPSTIAQDYEPPAVEGDAGTWPVRETAWPPAQAILALKSAANAFPVTDDEIDWPAFADWSVFCVAKNLKYNRLHDFHEPLKATLAAIGAAGRAVIRKLDDKWTVIIDRPRDVPVALVNSRNSSQFRWHKELKKNPDGLRVPFRDAARGHVATTRIVRWPGFVGPIKVTEERAMPWATDAGQVYVETRRFMHESDHRDVGYSVVQQGAVRSAQPGDLVVCSRDAFTETPASARVKMVRGNLVVLDDMVAMKPAVAYGIQFMVATAMDPRGRVVTRAVASAEGDYQALRVTGDGELPTRGDLIHFGPVSEVSLDLIMLPSEPGKDGSTILRFLPAATIIDELTDADALAIPPFDGRVGEDIGGSGAAPAAPVFKSIESGTEGTGSANGLRVLLQPGRGSIAIVAEFRIQHRLQGAVDFSGPVIAPAAHGAADIPGYAFGDIVELQAWAVSIDGVPGITGPIVAVTIGETDFGPPEGPASYFFAIF